MTTRAAILILLTLILTGAATAPATAPSATPFSAPSTAPSTTRAAARSVWDGVYSAEQLGRGKGGYNAACTRCHGEGLMGNDDAPPLVGKEFLARWSGQSVGSLVDVTQKTMPSDGPGKLSRKLCTDITAYVLSANGFPPGKADMPPDFETLNAITIQVKK